MARTLKDLNIGESAVVSLIQGKGPVKRRLMDMGVIKGTSIIVEKVAPLGDPIEVKVKGYNLTFRKEEAENIIVE